MSVAVCLLPFAFSLPASAAAQLAHPPLHASPVIPLELLERSVPIRTGIGAAHHPIATTSSKAQAFYDQGLAHLHSFVWIEAARSFNEALRHDAHLALAHVGLSYAYVELNRPREARDALDRARAIGGKLTEHDRRHVELRALQAAAEEASQDASRLAAYRQALDEALEVFPYDAELWLQRGMAESPDPAERGQGSTAGSVPYYRQALTLGRDGFAAHHYLTHAFENAGRIAEALEHGERYATLAPNVPHARHMHGHNLRRSGRVPEAIAEFEAADRLHRAYVADEQVPAAYDWHYHHNLDLLASSYQYVGQMKKAETTMKASFALPSNLVVQVFNKRAWPAFLRARGRPTEAFEAASVLKGHPHPLVQAAGLIESGATLVALARFADAASEYNTALRLLRSGPEGAPMAATALLGLQGELSLRTAQRERGRELFQDLAARLQAEPGPDHWVQALFQLESLARTARQVGDWELAGRMAQAMIEHDPAYAGSHYAAGLVAERNEDTAGAERAFRQAQTLWSAADADLPELVEIRRKVTK